jgi:hypothetical protein
MTTQIRLRLILVATLAAAALGLPALSEDIPTATAEATAPVPRAVTPPNPPSPAETQNGPATASVPPPAPTTPGDSPPASAATADAPATQAPAQRTFSQEQLDQLVAPIALYPDQLLTQVLMASTYPLEIVDAARWVHDPANHALKGDALAEALKAKGWEPSVMALVPFPQVLETMDSRLDWLRDLGAAFVAQQADVMAAVQRLRHFAMAAGTLKTTPQCHCVVATEGETITIAAVQPGPVCIPAYRPRVAYGAWPYPEYPPVEFPVPYDVAFLPGAFIGFYPGIDIGWYGPLWGWGRFDWGAGHIVVDTARWGFLAVHDARFAGGVWAHDPSRWGAVGSWHGNVGHAAVGAAGVAGAAAFHNGAQTAVLRGGSHIAAAGSFHGGMHGGGGHWAGRGGPAHFGGGHFGGGGPHGGGHFGGAGHFAMGGGHFGGAGHFAMGGGHGGGGGGGHHGH